MAPTTPALADYPEEVTDVNHPTAPANQVSTHWTRENLAWVAGIIEGEGYIGYKRLNRNTDHCVLQVSVSMTDFDVICRLHAITGVGNVCGPYQRSPMPNRKPTLDWSVYGTSAYAILVALIPWFGNRRRETAMSAIAAWLQAPGKGANRKLTDDQVRSIRHAVNVEGRTIRSVADEFGSNHHSIMQIARGIYYKTVPAVAP